MQNWQSWRTGTKNKKQARREPQSRQKGEWNMDIRITKQDADYLWRTLNIKDNPRSDNNDEQWTPASDGNRYYQLYDYDNIVIKAIFEVKDYNAPMDSTDFCDWDNYDELYIVSDG